MADGRWVSVDGRWVNVNGRWVNDGWVGRWDAALCLHYG